MYKTKFSRGISVQKSVGSIVENRPTGSMTLAELVLVGVGGIIGAGFFLGSGLPIRTAGPAVLLAFLAGGFITMQTTGALNSLAFEHPSEGAFKVYADIYIGRFMGYLQGWTYYLTSILVISSEAVASAIFVRLWLPTMPLWLMSSAFAALVLLINAFGAKDFSVVESFMSVIKTAALIGFILVAGMVILGDYTVAGTPAATSALRHGGFFPHGFRGLAQSMLIVIFAYAGIGVFATAAVHLRNPKQLDTGGIATVAMLTGLYLLSIGGILLLIPWSTVSAQTSPFVQALQRIQLPAVANMLNAVILVAAFSVMAGSVFSANQILISLGEGGEAPRFTAMHSEKRRTPYGALATTTVCLAVFIGLSYVLPSTIYELLISSSSFFTFFNWFVILLTFLVWRRFNQGKQVSLLAMGQPISTWMTMGLIALLSGYALLDREQRMGFYACLVIAALLVIGYFFAPKRQQT